MNKRYDELLVPLCGKGIMRRLEKKVNYYLVFKWMMTFILSVVLFGSCREMDPEIIDPIKPGKRDYVWTIDSVDYGNLPGKIRLESIWGSSATDVWGAAPDAGNNKDCLWHFDGVKWSRATDRTPITDFSSDKNIYAVWGSARNNVWAFGRNTTTTSFGPFIMHFDGTRWADATPSDIAGLKSVLYNVYGVSKDNIWVGGFRYVLHYDGFSWFYYSIGDSMSVGAISGNNKSTYFTGYNNTGTNFHVLFRIADHKILPIDTTIYPQYKFGNIFLVTANEIKSLANGVIQVGISEDGTIDKNGWNQVFTTETFLTEKYVQNTKNVFAVGQWNLVYHWNGINWKQLSIQVPNHTVNPYGWFIGVWTDESEVFISDWLTGIVYHGK